MGSTEAPSKVMTGTLKFEKCQTTYSREFDGEFQQTEITGMIGPSGSGKSTLMKCLADIIPHTGDVYWKKLRQADTDGNQWRKWVRYVHSETLWWSEKVGDHMTASSSTAQWMEDLGLDMDLMQADPKNLSSGESRRLGILRAALDMPGVLLLDEPAANLDEGNRDRVGTFLHQYHATHQVLMVIVSHDIEWLQRWVGKTVTIDELYRKEV